MAGEAKGSSVEAVAQACNITVRRVNQLAAEGVFPKEARGVYNLGKCMAAYIRYLQQALDRRSTTGGDGEIRSLQAERTVLVKTQREREELELAKARGEVLSLADHERILADLIIETKARMMAVAPTAAAQVLGETSRVMIQAKVEKLLKEAMVLLSKAVPRRLAPAEPAAPADSTPKEKAAKPSKRKSKGS